MDQLSERIARLSPDQLDALMRRLRGPGDASVPAAVIARRPGTGPCPLSFAQQRMWFIQQLDPRSVAYSIVGATRMEGPLDAAVLERALHTVVQRHEALRTVFVPCEGEPAQQVVDGVRVPLVTDDLSDLDPAEHDAEVERHARLEQARPFDLAAGPLLRALLLRLAPERHVLLITMHHVISDGWSRGIIVRETTAAYEALLNGDDPRLPELPIQYPDYAVWQRERLQGAVLDEQLGYWREKLAGAPALLELPTDHPRPPVQSFAGRTHRFALPDLQALRELGRDENATLFMVLLAAYKTLLARYTGQAALVVGTPVANRGRSETQGLVGFFANTLALHTDLSGDPTFREALRRVRDTALGAYAHEELPFDRLVEELHPERTLGRSLVFQSMFLLDESPPQAVRMGALELGPMDVDAGTCMFDLTLGIEKTGGGFAGRLEYATALFDASTAERMAEHLCVLLRGIAADPDARISTLPLMGEGERALLAACNATARDYPDGVLVHDLFAVQAARTPDAPALVARGDTLSYGELDARANRLANHLRGRGVGPEARVGVCIDRSVEMVVALLGVLKAGGAYVPLDPAYPRERLDSMVADAGIRLVLTTSALADRVSGGAEAVPLDALRGRIASEPAAAPVSGVLPENLSHVIFTSGSTGRPKGVMIRHSSTATLLHWMRETVADVERASVLGSTSISFDVSVAEMFGALCWGGTLVLVENALELPSVADPPIRYVSMVPTAAAELLRSGGIPASVRTVNLAGEALPNDLAQGLYALSTVETVRNLYGPTEDTSYSTFSIVAPGADRVLIGRPLANSRAYVLDDSLLPAPLGVPGELYLAGAGLARGYETSPGLTSERFLPDPFGIPGERMYRTMDRVRWTASGELEYFGRTDLQVKVRGFRIELGEIETALRSIGSVADAVVVVREDAPGDRRLVAYLVPATGAEVPAAAELRARLKERLPEYMVPSAFVALDALPLTGSGKVDRKALPAPDGSAADGTAFVAPRTPSEELLAGIFAEVLGLEQVGVHDDFFDAGGHSLLAMRVVTRVRDALRADLPVRVLFEAPTVAAVAVQVDALRQAGASADAASLAVVPREGPLPLSFAQHRLWFIDQMEPGRAAYNLAGVLRLRGVLDVPALERSLAEVVRRHEVLRTRFASVDGEPVQVIDPAGPLHIRLIGLGDRAEGEREAALRALAADEALRPFDLTTGPLLRSTLVRLADEEHALLFTMHHIISDGWSLGVLVREVSELYAAFTEGRVPSLPALPFQYADYATWQRAHLAGEVLDAQLGYWREALDGAPPRLELPADRPRPAVASEDGGTVPFALPAGTTGALRALSRREGATLFMTLLAGWQLLLSRYSGQDDVLVGSPIAGRGRVEVENLVGFFVNTLVLRGDLSGDPTFGELLGRVREAALGAYAHQDVPFEKLVEELQPERSRAHTPFFQVMFSQQNQEQSALRLGTVEVEALRLDAHTARFELSFALAEDADGVLRGVLTYRTDLFDAGTAERMLGHYAALLQGVANDASRRLSAYPLLGDDERRQVVERWNATAAEVPDGGCVHERFAAQAARTPDAPAVVFGAEGLTYAELDARANRLAHHLRGLGVGPDARVGLCLERGADVIAAILGILKSGGAYLPLDPTHPADRLLGVLADAGALVLVTRGATTERLTGFAGAVVRLDVDAELIARESPDPPAVAVSPENLAYVIYTSGSTGRPKGVMVQHRSVVNLHAALDRTVNAGRDRRARVSVNGPVTFDTSVKQIVQLLGGATLCIIPEDARYDADALGAYLREHAVEVLDCTPAQLRALMADGLLEKAGSALTDLLVAGEAIDPALWATLAGLDGVRAWNLYGPTETTVDAALRRVACERPLLGGPIANARLYVLDPAGVPAPVGVPGELYVGGAGVARGYTGQPALTAERFVPDAFAATPGARLYRTGDRVRWTMDGEAEYLGRTDFQLKISGFRIEPGEIEAVLELHPAVRRAVVIAREDVAGERRLVGYVVSDTQPSASELRAHLKSRLPDYMVPGAFVALNALPLTRNGKIDRRALPVPDAHADDEACVAPRTAAEEILAGIFAEVLGAERVDATDDFFALGGHSLLATRLIARVRQAFSTELPLGALFEHPTVEGLAAAVDAAASEGRGLDAPPVVPVSHDGALPLSFAQHRLWFMHQLEPASAAYNIPYALRLRGELDADALERSLTEIVRRHETLRTRFPSVDGEPVQVVDAAGPVPVDPIDVTHLAADEREAATRELAAAEAARPFDLATGPLLRASLVRLGDDENVLLVTLHHIVSDGWSTGVLAHELSALYSAFVRGAASPLGELPVQYADFAVWQRAWLSGDVLDAQLGWWRERLADAPPLLEIPTDRPRPLVAGERGGSVRFRLPAGATAALRSLSRREGATLFMTLLAGWQLLLSRYSGQEDVSVGSPIAGRTRLETEGLIGFFVNTLVLRTDLSGEPSFRALLGRVREATLGAYQHQDIPFEKLVEELQPERSLAHTPLFQAMFILQNNTRDALRLGLVEADVLPAPQETAKFDLTLALAETDDAIEGTLSYRADLFDATTAERMLTHFGVLLGAVAAEPDLAIGDVSFLGADERRALRAWNATERDYPAGLRVPDLFAAQVARTPDAAALVFRGASMTYGELDARANRLANHLRGLGVGVETRVGVSLERTPELIVALLAVHRAGGAYVPLDPAYPRERLGYMATDADIRYILTTAALSYRLPAGAEAVCIDVLADRIAAEDAKAPRVDAGPETLSHVIFTSGSTGRPKGVMIRHSSTVVLLHWLRENVTDDERAAVLASTSINFDVSVAEIFGTLCWGGTLVLVENALELPMVTAPQIRYASMVPTAAAELLRSGGIPASVRTITLGGEAVPNDLAQALYALGTVDRVGNGYGPTEDTTYSTYAVVGRGTDGVSIGRPLANTQAHVLDAGLRPVPVGVAGELYLAGHGLSRGYAGRPALTAERFVPDPFGAPGSRMYRVMDRVRWTAEGELEYFGRTDFQVKLRGFRIELGEIESALREHASVREAVAVVREDAPGDRRLVAYVVAGAGAVPAMADLRAGLKERLPEYMVPSAIIVLDALPTTPNGKIDRRALPAPAPVGDEGAYVPARTPAEEIVAGIFADVLRVERVGAHDDFFALGGHSLLATRVVSRVREAFGAELPVRALFEAPTVESLAALIGALARHADAAEVPPLVPVARDGVLPLSFAQQRLWFLHQLDPASPAYLVPAALRLRGALDVAALERALAEIVRRHEALRTTFHAQGGQPVQVIAPPAPFGVRLRDLRALPRAEREDAARRLAADEAARPFDLEREWPLRARLVRLDEDEWQLSFTMHHIASDGWSTGVLVREVSALYGAFVAGEASPLPELPVQYADYATWQRDWLGGGVLDAQLDWWRGVLAGAPPLLELPTDRPRPLVQGDAGGERPFHLPRATAAALRELARKQGATPFMVLLAAWQALLARYAGADDVSVGAPIAGRTRLETEGLIGFFVNTLVLRTDTSGDPSFRALLGRVRETTLGAYQHQDIPFEKLVEELQPERSLGHTPLFQAMLILQNHARNALRLGDVQAELLPATQSAARFDLTLALAAEEDGALAGTLSYRAELFDAATAERMLEHFAALLVGAVAQPDRRLSHVPLLGDAERERVLREWNDTDRDYPADVLVHHLFAAQAVRTPDATALVFRGEAMTYGALEARANRLANYLRRLGAGPEARVGVCMERAPEMVVALLGVLKAGGAYVPLDPAYPRERLGFMVQDAGIRLVLTTTALADRLPEGAEPLCLDALRDRFASESSAAPESGAGPENLSHVIFTSGSTGRPKGVMVRHAAVATLLHWMRENVADEERAAVLGSTSISFDVSVAEIFGALCWGGTLVLVENALDLPGVADRGIRYASMVPAAAAELLRSGGIPTSLRSMNLAGEALPSDLAQALYGLGTIETVRNLYGPTEDTSYSTCSVVERGARRVLIGRPLAKSRAYVLDAGQRPAPAGVPGELYLGGAGVARGYEGRPALTAERFLPDPYGPAGSRMYRTMDRVRWTAAGELEYFGRTDFQVKLRGFRIELGEIESALREHASVGEAVAVVREDAPGDRRLVAYVVAGAGAVPAMAELRAGLKGRLPEYMVPSAVIVLDALPTTPNGKIDRRALPAPAPVGDEGAYVPARTPAEEIVAGIFADVLRVERVGAHDDFFALGGHSLLATRVVSRVRTALSVELPLRTFFEHSSVEELAARLDALSAEGPGVQAPPVVPVPREGPLPLSFAQERLWVLDQLEPGSAAYNLPAVVRLRGRLDADALRWSLDEVVRRHEALRTVFRDVDGAPAQVMVPAAGLALPELDLRPLDAEARSAALGRHVRDEAARPFDLAAGPLMRAVLLRLDENEAVLLVTMHHIVSDGWSMRVLVREVAALYEARVTNQASPLADLPVQYADYAAWQRAWLAGDVLEERLAYWRARLAGAPPVLELPTDYPRPAVQGRRGERAAMELPRALVDALQALSRQEGATLFMTLLAAFKAVLARQAGQDDVVVGTPVANRTRTEAEGLIGFFVNTLALRTDLSGAPSFRELVARVRETTLGAYVNQDVPFERVLEELRPERTLSHAPVFQVFFNLMNLEEHEVQLPGITLEPVLEEAEAHSKFDLTLYARPHADGMSLTLVYDPCLFAPARMTEMLAQYRMLLEQAVGEPEAAIPSFSLVSGEARARLPDPALPLDDGWMGSVPAVFAARAAEAPERLAAEDAAERWTYGELDARSNQLARFLAGSGVEAGDVVAVFGHRSASLVWALMGILKAGAAFVVLDPSYPPARLQQYLRGSEPRAWLRVEAAGEPPVELEPSLPACRLALPGRAAAEAAGLLAEWPAEPLPVEIGPDSLAYLSFTSGTTGVPKAVMGRHGSLTHFIPWLVETFGLHAGDRFSMLSGIAHDPLQRDVFTPLQLGAAVCAPPEAALEVPGGLARWMRDAEVSVAHLTPSMGKVITDLPAGAEAERVASLRLAFFVGEALTRGEVSRLRSLAPDVRVVNYYGSTETQRAVGWFDAVADTADAAGAREVVPLGRGIRDVQLLVLNGAGALAGVGEVGEIHVRSPHVALGYRGDAELTAQRFLPALFAASPGDRMYRTGDLGRYRPDGVVEPLGRADQQVKVRGFRVELGEIEALLASHPAVREAVVAAREDVPGERRLVAYVVAAPGCDAPDAAGLRAYLRARVPEHMVPAAFVALDALPLTPNAKVDRRALPAPPEEDGGAAGAAPLSASEEIVAGIFADVLGMERVGVHDDFFALGGHSLLATRVATRARAAFGTELPLRVFFQSPTPAGLAEWLDEARAGPGREPPPIVRVSREGAVLPLSFAQQRLWAVNQMESESRVYNQGFGFRLRGRLDVRALEQAMTELTRRHAVFRTRFVERHGVPGQVIGPPRPVPLPVVDLSGLEDREAVLARLARDHTAELFDLRSGVLLRLLLVRLAEDEHALLVVMHHITCDGWSMGIIRRDVAVLYHAFAEGRPSPLSEPALQYADYAVWQRAWLSEEREREQLAFWRDRLDAVAPLYLATNRTRAEGTDGETRHFGLPSGLSDSVRRLSHALGATPFMTLLAAFQVLLRWQGAGEDVVVGTDVANRNLRTETEDVVGFFVNQLVLRTSLGGNPAFGELVERVREVTLAAYDHQDLPFERVVAALQPRRAAGETPFFRVKFAMQTVPGGTEPVALPGLVLEPLVPERTGAQMDVLLSMFDTGDHLRGLWEYRTSLFSTQLIDRWTRRYQDVLEAAVADPGLRLDALRARLDSEEVRGAQGAQEALKERRRARFARP